MFGIVLYIFLVLGYLNDNLYRFVDIIFKVVMFIVDFF